MKLALDIAKALLIKEAEIVLPVLARRIVLWHASRLPEEYREELREQFLSDLHQTPGSLGRLWFALDLARAVSRIKGSAGKANKWPVTAAFKWRMAAVGVSIVSSGVGVALAIAFYFGLPNPIPATAELAIRTMLTAQRPFESRMSDQPYVPFVMTRGSSERLPTAQLEIWGFDNPTDAYELGRFYLLQHEFERSISYLEIAAHDAQSSADVHNDLGVACLESGLPERLSEAAEEFERALRVDPRFAPALFNLSLYYERVNSQAESQAHWQEFLQMYPESPWSREARVRLREPIR